MVHGIWRKLERTLRFQVVPAICKEAANYSNMLLCIIKRVRAKTMIWFAYNIVSKLQQSLKKVCVNMKWYLLNAAIVFLCLSSIFWFNLLQFVLLCLQLLSYDFYNGNIQAGMHEFWYCHFILFIYFLCFVFLFYLLCARFLHIYSILSFVFAFWSLAKHLEMHSTYSI